MKQKTSTFLMWMVALSVVMFTHHASSQNLLTNGNFDQNLTGWSVSGPTLNYNVANFDIDGPGSLPISKAFYGKPGSGSYIINLSQNVSLTAGRTYLVTADIASIVQGMSYNGTIALAGIIEVTISGTMVASHNFGPTITQGSPLYAALSGTFLAPSTGSFVFNVKIYKTQYSYNQYHYNYIDNVSLTWQAPQVTLTTAVNPLASGTITKVLDKPTYNEGETVALTAHPADWYMFASWTGDLGGAVPTNNPLDLLMDQNRSVTANFSPANVWVKLLDGSGGGMSGGVVQYFDGGWQTAGVTNASGELRFNYTGIRQRLNFRMTYEGITVSKNNQAFTSPIIFQTANMQVVLKTALGTGLPGGEVEYFSGGWKPFGITGANGIATKGLFPGYYSFRMTYEGKTETRSNINISTVNPLVFNTVAMVVRFEHPLVGGIKDGEVVFKSDTWRGFGITDNAGNTSKQLLPGTYDFSMTFQGNTEVKTGINISVTNPLIFNPKSGSTVDILVETKITSGEGINNGFAFKEYQGETVAISGSKAVVGARSDKGPSGTGSSVGAAYVYEKTPTGWQLLTKLFASDGQNNDKFGGAVAIDGDLLVIGAPGYSLSKGAAYVFKWNGTNWVQQQKLIYNNTTYPYSNYYGSAVGVSGTNIVIGAPGTQSYGRGELHFYSWNGTTWTKTNTFTGAAYYEYIGKSVAISGNYAIVGTQNDKAYIYEKTTSWTLKKTFTGVSGSIYGYAVSISGDYAVVGAALENHAPNGNNGAAYVYYRDAGVWAQVQRLISGSPYQEERFGISVGISGDKIIVGTGNWIGSPNKIGSAFVFKRNGPVWDIEAKIGASDGTSNNQFGYSLGYDNGTVIVAATGADGYIGAAYVYTTVNVTIPKITVPQTVESIPEEFTLANNYPNPFNPATTISFTVAEPGPAVLTVFNMLGQEVAKLFEGIAEPGKKYEVRFDGSGLASGMYLYRLQSGTSSAVRKMLLLK